MSFDLTSMTLSDTIALQDAVKQHLQTSVEQQKDSLRSTIVALAETTNRSVPALLNELFPTPAPVIRYRDPSDPKYTWTGRGMQPKWLKAAVAAGATLESFEVK